MTFDFLILIIHYIALKIRNRIFGFLKITLNFQNFSCNFLGIVHLSRNGDGTEQKEDAGIFPEKHFFRKFPAFVLLRDALFLHMHNIMVQTQSQYSSTTNELKYVCM